MTESAHRGDMRKYCHGELGNSYSQYNKQGIVCWAEQAEIHSHQLYTIPYYGRSNAGH